MTSINRTNNESVHTFIQNRFVRSSLRISCVVMACCECQQCKSFSHYWCKVYFLLHSYHFKYAQTCTLMHSTAQNHIPKRKQQNNDRTGGKKLYVYCMTQTFSFADKQRSLCITQFATFRHHTPRTRMMSRMKQQTLNEIDTHIHTHAEQEKESEKGNTRRNHFALNVKSFSKKIHDALMRMQ